MARPRRRAALVTGASRGIGRAIVERLASDGWEVAAVARTPSDPRAGRGGAGRRRGGRVLRFRMDVRDRAAVERVVTAAAAELGGLDAIVNNAGVGGDTPIDGPDDARWHDILATNLTGPMLVVRAALPHLRRGAAIVNVSSVLGKFGVARKGAYCASKHGLIGWTRALALELAPRGVAVNAICPGWVDTAMARDSMDQAAAAEGIATGEFRRRALAAVPQRRFLAPAEIAALIAYLLSPAARGLTGQAIAIDAGATPF